jgi:uncharacterized protein
VGAVEEALGKILLFLIVLFVALFVLRLINPRKKKSTLDAAPSQGAAPTRQIASEPMLACAHCKTLVPQSEAVIAQDKAYCSREHAQLGER